MLRYGVKADETHHRVVGETGEPRANNTDKKKYRVYEEDPVKNFCNHMYHNAPIVAEMDFTKHLSLIN